MAESKVWPLFKDDRTDGKGIHTWDQDEKECGVCEPRDDVRVRHFMRCSKCGATRSGPYAEHGNYHYFFHTDPVTGRSDEIVPPCCDTEDVMEVQICGECHCLLRENGRCPEEHTADPITLRGCPESAHA